MEALYTAAEADIIRRRARRLKAGMLAVALTGLAVCVGLCFGLTTANTDGRRLAVIAVSAAAGWTVILLRAVWFVPARAVYTHMDGVLSAGEREIFSGVLSVEKGAMHIPKSIWIRAVTLTGPDGRTETLSVLADKAGQLPPDGTPIRAETVRRYILAWEVPHEEA